MQQSPRQNSNPTSGTITQGNENNNQSSGNVFSYSQAVRSNEFPILQTQNKETREISTQTDESINETQLEQLSEIMVKCLTELFKTNIADQNSDNRKKLIKSIVRKSFGSKKMDAQVVGNPVIIGDDQQMVEDSQQKGKRRSRADEDDEETTGSKRGKNEGTKSHRHGRSSSIGGGESSHRKGSIAGKSPKNK